MNRDNGVLLEQSALPTKMIGVKKQHETTKNNCQNLIVYI